MSDHATAGAPVLVQAHRGTFLKTLLDRKAQAREHRGISYLRSAVPQSQQMLEQMALRQQPLGSATAALLRLLAHYGQAETQIAVQEALSRGVPHPNSVRHILERRHRERSAIPPVPVPLPPDGRLDIAVGPHELSSYDTLSQQEVDDDKIF